MKILVLISNVPDTTTKIRFTGDNTAFDAFGITYNATAGIMGNFNNGLVDQITIGRGLQLTAGDGASTPGDFAGFINYDEGTNIYGFVSRVHPYY